MTAGLVALVLVAGLALAVVLLRDGTVAPRPEPGASAPSPTLASDPRAGSEPDPALKPAVSRAVEDSVYPNVGDPGVDALRYDLDLAWSRKDAVLTGTAAIDLRATVTADEFRLDLGDPLEVGTVTLDDVEVETEHIGKDLVVKSPVVADRQYHLVVEYAGTPEPVRAPSQRSDFSTLGWTVTESGEVWTMQEPYGAFTWYPVNDQPADKAFYDFTISAPPGWVGVANGELVSRRTVDGRTVTRFHLDSPASSYLTTIAIGDLVTTRDRTSSGVPLTYWTPRGDKGALRAMEFTAEAITWLEKRLGPYPFDTGGGVVVDSQSAMETQSLPTYGNNPYALSRPVMVHELAHQWYGDLVSPTDWRDMWMNEGMVMYLQGQYEADQARIDVDQVMDEWAAPLYEPTMREEAGPPGAYDPAMFGEGNVYYGPALMWHEVREKIGDERFWSMVRAWPRVHAGGNATRRQYLAWVEKHTGEELTALFDAWLMGATSPPR
jgi:aminopeptidase N